MLSDTTRSSSFRPAPLFERVTDPVVLNTFLTQVETGLSCRPHDPLLQRRRADLLRCLGRLDDAAAIYRELADLAPTDVEAAEMATVLQGEASGPVGAVGPVRFVRVCRFLSEQEQQQLWRFVMESVAVEPSRIGEGTVNPAIRQSALLREVDAVRSWFLPRIDALIEREGVLERLGMPPFDVTRRELQITRHMDGDHYRSHRDSGGEGKDARTLTYVYYFHRLPRVFSGGDILLFDEVNAGAADRPFGFTRLEPICNSVIFFASSRLHMVTKIACPSDDLVDGRWTVNGWYHRPE